MFRVTWRLAFFFTALAAACNSNVSHGDKQQGKASAETHAAIGITNPENVHWILRVEKGYTEYVGTTPEFVYSYLSGSNETKFLLYPKGGEFIFVGTIIGDKVVLAEKKQYRPEKGDSQCGSPGSSIFTSFIIEILADPANSTQQKEERCRERLKELMTVFDQGYHSGKWPIRPSSVKVSAEVLFDKERIQFMPDQLFEKVKDMKVRKKYYLDL